MYDTQNSLEQGQDLKKMLQRAMFIQSNTNEIS